MFDLASGSSHSQATPSEVKSRYDFIVCGSGSSGSVVASRLAEDPDVQVLLLEAGGGDDMPEVTQAGQWPMNLGSERDWGFAAIPNPRLNGRAMPLNMGRVLGGGSSINAMIWARGHKNDWDYFAAEAGDNAWNYESALTIYRRIEDWHGAPDPKRRGTGGPVYVQPAFEPNPIAPAFIAGAASLGVEVYDDAMGRMMEGAGGVALNNLRIRNDRRESVFRTYVSPMMDRPNLTVLSQALVLRVLFEGRKAVGVEIFHEGTNRRIYASLETVLSLGSINTPKLLMQSGIGDEAELKQFNIPVVQHLPGVGKNFQDHIMVSSVWEYQEPLAPRNNGGEVTLFWKSDSSLVTPDLQLLQAEFPLLTPENAHYASLAAAWSIAACLVRPGSSGRVSITGSDPLDPVQIDTNTLEDPADLQALLKAVEFSREIGNSASLRAFAKREVMPASSNTSDLETFIRNGISTVWHQASTAKMGRDPTSVVDGELKVYGVQNLRVADASIMPRVTTGNTMAPCVIIGERAAEMLQVTHKLKRTTTEHLYECVAV
jgi:choline dehydrogenase